MKKLIAISVMLVLLTSAVFAQETSIGFTVEARANLFDGTLDTAAVTRTTGGQVAEAYLQASAASDDGTMGGLVRITQTGAAHRAFVWWKPIEQVQVFFGRDNDGRYKSNVLARWDFHRGNGGVAREDWDYDAAFPGNWDGFGLAFETYPIEGLNINLVIPAGNGNAIDVVYPYSLRLTASYALPSLGTIFFNYTGAGRAPTTDQDGNFTFGTIGASFLLDGPVENLKAQLGAAIELRAVAADGDHKNKDNSILNIGLAAYYDIGEFSIKLRGRVGIPLAPGGADGYGGWYQQDAVAEPGAWYLQSMFIKGNIMPGYNFGAFSVYCDIGLLMRSFDKVRSATALNNTEFWVNPYIKIPLGGGSGNLFAGIYIGNRGVDLPAGVPDEVKALVNPTVIRVPIGMNFSF